MEEAVLSTRRATSWRGRTEILKWQ